MTTLWYRHVGSNDREMHETDIWGPERPLSDFAVATCGECVGNHAYYHGFADIEQWPRTFELYDAPDAVAPFAVIRVDLELVTAFSTYVLEGDDDSSDYEVADEYN